MLHTFCVAHKPLEISLPEDANIIWLGEDTPPAFQGHSVFRLDDVAPELRSIHRFIGGSAGTFIISKLLKSREIPWEPDDTVLVCQYRKFISATRQGTEAPNYPGMFLIDSQESAHHDWFSPIAFLEPSFLLPKPLDVGYLYYQYCSSHHAQDLLRYIAIAIDNGIISWEQSAQLLASNLLIPGGIEFGLLPIDFYIEGATALEVCTKLFLTTHAPTSSDPAQIRAASFCNERLGSLLALNKLTALYGNQLPEHLFGWMHTVTHENRYLAG